MEDSQRQALIEFHTAREHDPVDLNPFPPGSRRHEAWAEATRTAERDISLVNAAFVTNSLANEPYPHTFEELLAKTHNATRYHRAWLMSMVSRKFDVWAKRGVSVVWTEADLAIYDDWLVAYAKSWIEGLREKETEPVLGGVRVALLERLEFWKAEARRYKSEVEAALRTAAPKAAQARLTQHRKRIVRDFRKRNGDLTMEQFARRVAKSASAIYGMIKCDTKKFNAESLQEFLDAIKVPLEEWNRAVQRPE